MVLDALAVKFGVGDAWKTKDGARQILCRARSTVLVQPQSFMNSSGQPTALAAAWYKIPPPHVLVVVDDLDLPFGKLRMRERGSSGGHNGLKSLIEHLGEDFPRLRVGIGRDVRGEAINRVLGNFSPEEAADLSIIIETCVHGIGLWLESTSVIAINFLNSFKLDMKA